MNRGLSALADEGDLADDATVPDHPLSRVAPPPNPPTGPMETVASLDAARTARPEVVSNDSLPAVLAPTELGEVDFNLAEGDAISDEIGTLHADRGEEDEPEEPLFTEAPDVDIDDGEDDPFHPTLAGTGAHNIAELLSQTSEHPSATPELTRLRVEREILLRHMMQVNRRLAERVEEQTATLREQSQHLAAANRAKDLLLARTGHDVRNGVGVVLAYSSLLAPGLEPEKVEFLKSMEGACRHLIDLLDDLVDDAALASGSWSLRPAPFVIEELLDGVCAQLRDGPYRRKKQTLRMVHGGEPHGVLADAKRIGQVVRNYLDNASKYSRPSTEVEILVRMEGSELIVEVNDRGLGIPRASLPHLFEASADIGNRPTGGERSSGIGLSIVSDIVKRHGGRCWGVNREGGGSTFAFAIPKAGPPPVPAPAPPPPSEGRS